MKKFLALLLCLLTAVMLLASCAGGEDAPEKLVEDAFAKTNDLDAYEIDMAITVEVSMAMMGETMTESMPMNVKMTAKDLKTETPKIAMVISMAMEGEEFSADAYIEGNWMYMTSDGESYKVALDALEESDMGGMTDYSKQLEELFVDLPEVVFDGVSATKNSDGSSTVALTLTAEQFEEVYASFVESFSEGMGGMITDGVDLTFKPTTLSVTVKDGFVSKYDMDFAFDMAMDMDGNSATTEDAMSMNASIDYKIDILKTSGVTVTPPEGYLEFEEIPMN